LALVYDERRQKSTVLDHDGEYTTYGSKNKVLTPVLYHTTWNSNMFVYNVHVSSTAVDSIIECTKTADLTEKQTNQPSCSIATEFKMTQNGDLVSLIYEPIYPSHDPTTLVGVIGLSVHFKDVLIRSVPDYFDGVTTVISTRTIRPRTIQLLPTTP
jgi:hypothetical protein